MVFVLLVTGQAHSDWLASLQAGGNRLVATQNTDGGWGWPLTGTSAANTIGPIAMGLAQAYQFTGNKGQLDALNLAGSFLINKTNNFSPSDGYLAAELDRIFGGNAFKNHVITYFYQPLANGTYNYKGLGTLYNTAQYVNKIRTDRFNQGIANLAAWDIGMGLMAAASAGAGTGAWIAGTEAEIDELDGNSYYDVIGLAGALYGLAFVGEDFDPSTGEHAAASSLGDLAAILAGYQLSTGGFTWNSNYLGNGNETIQETAYAILALNQVSRSLYLSNISLSGNYLISTQLTSGGWEGYIGDPDGENNEITGEALWGIATAVPEPGTFLLLGFGLLGLAGLSRKKFFKK
jgi:hypothetical protein